MGACPAPISPRHPKHNNIFIMNENRKKILFVITKSNWGGAQKYVFDLATEMKKVEHDVIVALGGEGILKQKLESAGIKTISLFDLQRDISFFKEISSFISLYKTFRKEKPNVVHLNSSKASGLGALAARLAGVKKIIFTAHGWPFKEDRPYIVRRMIYLTTWFTVFLSHQTIVVSRQDESLGKHMRFVNDRIYYIPNAIKVGGLLKREKAEEILFYPDVDSYIINSVRLVTIAELTKNKGMEYGIDMMEELEKRLPGKYTYTIFGEGEKLPNLQNKSKKILNPQSQPIVFFRSVESNMPRDLSTEASRYLGAFDIFVLPSIKEGAPYVLLEAAAAGLPIVATDAVESVVFDLPNIHIVPSKSGSLLAEKVEEISSDIAQKPRFNSDTFDNTIDQIKNLYDL